MAMIDRVSRSGVISAGLTSVLEKRPWVIRMEWTDFPAEAFEVNGLYWWEDTRPELIRLPHRVEGIVRGPIWNLAQAPSGARIRFRTDSTSLAIRAHFPELGYMNNMPRTGQLGISLYVDGEYWAVAIPNEEHDLEHLLFEGIVPAEREICLYLGLYGPVEIQAIGLDGNATVSDPAPFARQRPVVYYGSSITQGGCASRSALSYQAILGRRLNLDFVNLGFSGNGIGEPEVARIVAEIDASCFVMDFCQNCRTPAMLQEAYAPFLQTIRDTHADTPIICITPIFSVTEIPGDGQRLADMRQVIRTAVDDRRKMGDDNIYVVEGYGMLGPDDREGLVDLTHPNDVGFFSMADGLEPILRSVLGL